MLKVMVVDDDYLVRQGIIRVMPWDRFGMKVVCEASNGAEALEKMTETDVDLLLTDLAMPVLSGLELIKQVRTSYPGMHVVVLTFHHEFELVKDALRLGVLDYITKVELENDQMGPILERIVERIRQRPPAGGLGAEGGPDASIGADEACAVFRVHGPEGRWELADAADAGGIGEGEASSAPRHPLDGIVVKWRGVKGMSKSSLLHKLRLRGENELFYGAEEGIREYEWPADRLEDDKPASREEIVQLGRGWTGLAWLTDAAAFGGLLERTAALKLPAAQLEQMLYVAMEEWGKVLDSRLLRFDEAERPQSWQAWVKRLQAIRSNAYAQTDRQAYSPAIVDSVVKAADYVKQRLNEDLQLPGIAREVNMSRSYFSKCFRDITGKTFQEYVRDCRIEHAGKLLRHTSKPISWVASESGYPNERYFSKVFREATGELPRDYRRKNLKSHN